MITTHVLDLESGAPASGVEVRLTGPNNLTVQAITDADGRISSWNAPLILSLGSYQLDFRVAAYFAQRGSETFFDSIPIRFMVNDSDRSFHVPLLLSPFGYSTYRGS